MIFKALEDLQRGGRCQWIPCFSGLPGQATRLFNKVIHRGAAISGKPVIYHRLRATFEVLL
ncbi:hypothetical protein CBM2589_B290005 [Cupriavidus taiwanensis]|uniref:Uncharacterized protein n=1 Tax=Cupriavidus taiwanensis TaxID=164546 RepID=A0A375BU05_9BURK|nr:hypothetical protein CBM2589_B290005 [Cupriavidus taiwanensis]